MDNEKVGRTFRALAGLCYLFNSAETGCPLDKAISHVSTCSGGQLQLDNALLTTMRQICDQAMVVQENEQTKAQEIWIAFDRKHENTVLSGKGFRRRANEAVEAVVDRQVKWFDQKLKSLRRASKSTSRKRGRQAGSTNSQKPTR